MTLIQFKGERSDIIQSLIDGVDRYNPDNVTILEDYLIQQLHSDQYDCMANLAILKLYQFHPHLISDQVIVNILVKALTVIPGSDFNLCLYLLSEQQVHEEPIQKLIELQQLLEQCKFVEFWKKMEGEDDAVLRDLTRQCVGFQDAVRRNVIVGTIRIAFQIIKIELAKKILNIKNDEAFRTFVQEQGWTIEGDLVHVPVNKSNEAKATVLRENLKYDQMVKIVAFSSTV